MGTKVNIHRKLHEECELAKVYAADGAFHSAASILERAAAAVKFHAVWCDAWLEEEMRKANAAALPQPTATEGEA